MTYLQLSFADATEYAGEFDQGMNQGHGVLTFNDKVRPRTNMESGSGVFGRAQWNSNVRCTV